MSDETKPKLFRKVKTLYKCDDKFRGTDGDVKAMLELFTKNYEAIFDEQIKYLDESQ